MLIEYRTALQAKLIGDFTFFSSYMSQPKTQLETFAAWAGKDSGKWLPPSQWGDSRYANASLTTDISYYLNSHHVRPSLSCPSSPSLLGARLGSALFFPKPHTDL